MTALFLAATAPHSATACSCGNLTFSVYLCVSGGTRPRARQPRGSRCNAHRKLAARSTFAFRRVALLRPDRATASACRCEADTCACFDDLHYSELAVGTGPRWCSACEGDCRRLGRVVGVVSRLPLLTTYLDASRGSRSIRRNPNYRTNLPLLAVSAGGAHDSKLVARIGPKDTSSSSATICACAGPPPAPQLAALLAKSRSEHGLDPNTRKRAASYCQCERYLATLRSCPVADGARKAGSSRSSFPEAHETTAWCARTPIRAIFAGARLAAVPPHRHVHLRIVQKGLGHVSRLRHACVVFDFCA